MTPIKLATVALGIASIGVGYWLSQHNAAVGASLTLVGGHLMGWAFPEIGKAES